MNKRQQNLNVTDQAIIQGVKNNEFLANYEAFKAKISTLKKGQYSSIELIKNWIPQYQDMESFVLIKSEEIKPFLFGLTANFPKYFNYSDTNGLDILTVK